MSRYVFIFYFVVNQCYGARILGVFPTPSISHQIVFRSLFESLATRGHHVTVLSTDPVVYTQKEYENLTQINLHDVSYPIWNRIKFPDLRNMERNAFTLMLMETMVEITEKELLMPEVQDIIHSGKTYDLCLLESWIPILSAFKEHFKCNMIRMTSLSGGFDVYDAIGNPVNPALYPDVYSNSFDDLNFWQRLINVYDDLSLRFQHHYHVFPMFEKSAKKIFPNNTISLWEIQKQTDLLFVSMNPILESVKPILPTVVVLGNMHIKPRKPLSKIFQIILDDARRGVVYFSLGSNVKSIHLSSDKIRALLDAFAELPYTILWKWENDTLPNKSSNVHCFNWMPQQDILAHPNVKAFITQGGYQSMEEGIYFKTPFIAIPFYSDQFFNSNKISKLRIGKHLDFEYLTKDIIKRTIIEVVEDRGYFERIEKLSNIIQDQPESSLERSIWWTEYVLRHNGTSHFRTPPVYMPIYQHFLLDIIAFNIICIGIIIYLIFKMIKYTLLYINLKYKKKEKIL